MTGPMTGKTQRAAGLFSRERAQQTFLYSATLPLKQGGGLVFPLGLLGTGYRLDEWQFDRFRANLDQSFLGGRAELQRQAAIAALVFVGLTLCAVLVAVILLLRDPEAFIRVFGPLIEEPILLMLVITAPLAVLFGIMAYPIFRQRARFLDQFPGAPRVSRFAHLQRRLLGWAVGTGINPSVLFFIAIAWVLLAVLWLLLAAIAGDLQAMRLAVGIGYLLMGLGFGSMSWAPWWFRRRHGRPATSEDLGPV